MFKTDVFFVLLKEELPNNSTSENLESFRFKISLSMFQMLFMRINLSSEKRAQWRRQWVVLWTSVSHLQIRFNKSWKLCLNLWSRRWLKPILNLVSNFTPWGLWQVKVLFGDGRMNCNMFFLKIEKLSEFLILLFRLFHLVTMDGKYEFLKKVCVTLNWGILPMFLVPYVLLTVGILLKRYLGDLLLIS